MGTTNKVLNTTKNVFKQEGPIGFYRGFIPPFIGSAVYRGAQFSTFEGTYTKLSKNESFCQPIPGTFGLERRVLAGGFAAGLARNALEIPFEYAKVSRQTGQSWQFRHAYKAFPVGLPRNIGIMTMYFSQVDSYRRHTNLMDSKLGQFWVSGVASVVGWASVWPFEIVKNLQQAGTKAAGDTTLSRFKFVYETYGMVGFTRGLIPASTGVFLRSGSAMIIMQKA